MDGPIGKIVICGGGTAGWMAAAALTRMLGASVAVTLIESDAIGTVGVGEATIPPIVQFNKMIGLDEDAFVRATHATYKLGIEFVDWLRPGHRYIHPFGLYGADMNEISFIHFWLRRVAAGGDPDPIAFNAEAQAAYQGRFARTGPRGAKINYAFQFDANLYAAHLRAFAEAQGAMRIEGRIAAVAQHPETGFITGLTLDDGRMIEGDLFLDCTGFRALLIERTLGAGYDDWSHWLPCNRAAAIPSVRVSDPAPLTRSTARDAGWQWRIPLQHRTGNGYVFSDGFITPDAAIATLMAGLDGAAQGEPRLLSFTSGRRRTSWVKNCVALGLASGFLEPLESTSIHFIHAALVKLLAYFPTRGFDAALTARFNAEMDTLVTGTRDFLIAHYKLTERDDTAFWRHCRALEVPDSLTEKFELFRSRGEVMAAGSDLFKDVNWFSILYGQGMRPVGHHPLADAMPDEALGDNLAQIAAILRDRVASMPSHEAFLRDPARCNIRTTG